MKALMMIALLWMPISLWAQPSGLGNVRVVVEDRSQEARVGGLRKGVERVLVRLTGDSSTPQAAEVASLLRDPSRWAQQYAYEAQESGELILAMQFDVPALMAQLETQRVPVWTLVRPQVVFWLVVQRSASGELLAMESTDPAALTLIAAAQERGLPMTLPLMDAEDQGRIRPADIRGQFDQVLMKAADRYQASFNVAAIMFPGAKPQLRWRLLENGRLEDSGQIDADTEQEVIDRMMDRVTNLIASRYRVVYGEPRPMSLTIDGVVSLADWRNLTTHVQGLAGVRDTRVRGVAGQRVTVNLMFTGEPEQLPVLLGLDPRLRPCATGRLAMVAPELTSAPEPAADLCWTP
ncbi:MAG: hypothetical protein CVV10_02220 [Gammaproteobacteria bacterium HGW-Gammaproteobacteria-14]|nr:MAG: hypothetical protein CVV10_02220 [Gammaproteobacteria bacterium HGW-Gammaproteobacteria-14]